MHIVLFKRIIFARIDFAPFKDPLFYEDHGDHLREYALFTIVAARSLMVAFAVKITILSVCITIGISRQLE